MRATIEVGADAAIRCALAAVPSHHTVVQYADGSEWKVDAPLMCGGPWRTFRSVSCPCGELIADAGECREISDRPYWGTADDAVGRLLSHDDVTEIRISTGSGVSTWRNGVVTYDGLRGAFIDAHIRAWGEPAFRWRLDMESTQAKWMPPACSKLSLSSRPFDVLRGDTVDRAAASGDEVAQRLYALKQSLLQELAQQGVDFDFEGSPYRKAAEEITW